MVRQPCGEGNNVTHAKCVLMEDKNSGAQRGIQAALGCCERRYARHVRRETLDAAVQADLVLRDSVAAFRGRPKEYDEGQCQETKIVLG